MNVRKRGIMVLMTFLLLGLVFFVLGMYVGSPDTAHTDVSIST